MAQLIVDQQDIARWIETQKGSLDLGVAFWGLGAIEQLSLKKHKKRLRVLLDLSAGASNPAEVKKLMALLPDRVRQVERLHAKAWIGASEMILGSANASANGLGVEGFEAQHWCELGMLSADPAMVEEAQAWFDHLWAKGSRPITSRALDDAQARWDLRRAMRPQPKKKGHLLDAAVSDPDYFTDLRVFVVVVNEEPSEKGEKARLRHQERTGAYCHCYEDWPEIPLDATLVSFTSYKEEGLKLDNPPLFATASEVLSGPIQIVYPKRRFRGLTVGPERDWTQRIERYAKRYRKVWGGGDICLELNEFVRLTNP